MRTIVEPLPHDLAVIAALETLGAPVGFANAPAGTLTSAGLPLVDFMTLYPIGGGSRDGSLVDPYADVEFVYQVMITGRLPEGVRHLAGQIESALIAVAIPDRRVTFVRPDDLEGVYTDRDVGPPHPFYSTPLYRLGTTPS